MIVSYHHIELENLPTAPGLVRVDMVHPDYPELVASYYAARATLREDVPRLISRFVRRPNTRLRKWLERNDLEATDYIFKVYIHEPPTDTKLANYDKQHLLLLQAISCRIHDHQESLLINSWLPGKRRCPVARTPEHKANISKALQGYYNWADKGKMVLLDGSVIEGNHRQLSEAINITPATLSNWLKRGYIPSIWTEVIYFKGRNGKVVLHAGLGDNVAPSTVENLTLEQLQDLGSYIKSENERRRKSRWSSKWPV
jgi:hypothetical protein